MLPISLCMIMKNESANLSRCLDSIKSYGFELILVDTGSSDNTVEIAGKYVDTVHHFTWIEDFSAARNYSISLASHDWVLILDCDEYISSMDISDLLSFMNNFPEYIGLLSRHNHYELNGTDTVYIDQVERFFNRKLYHYRGEVHEQVVPFSPVHQNLSAPINLKVEHTGYVGTADELYKKSMRNLKLLEGMLERNPDDPYLYFQIGQCYNLLHDDRNAAIYYERGLSYEVNPDAEYVQMMLIGYGYALLHLEEYEAALSLQNVYEEFSTSADFFCLMGLIYLRTGNLLRAMAEFLKALSCPIAHTQGSDSFIPYYNMGCINELLGEPSSALSLYKKCGNFPMALNRITELEKRNLT